MVYFVAKAGTAYTKPQQTKKEEGERLRGGRYQINLIGFRFERGQVVGFRKEEEFVCSWDEG